MPEISANIKIGLGILAATAALLTGLLGNVLAANISAFFSGTAPKSGKRPLFLWIAFFIAASISVVAGSVATFAPPAATPSPGPTHQVEAKPKIVVTNANATVQHQDAKSQFLICRDTVQVANTSDIPTSVVGVGTNINIDGTVIQMQPTDVTSAWSNGHLSVKVSVWRTAPASKRYQTTKTLGQFTSILGEPLPARVDARSTTAVDVDYALKFTTGMPQTVTATHTLRFPDIQDLQSTSLQCK